jgi:hypothetical protein
MTTAVPPARNAGAWARAPFVVLHWLAFASLVASILSGLRIHAANRALEAGGWWQWLPGGSVHMVHFATALLWVALVLAYLVRHRRVRSRAVAVEGEIPDRRGHANSFLIQLLKYALPLLLFSGLVLYFKGTGAWEGRVQQMHYVLAWALIATVAVHATLQLLWGRWPWVKTMLSFRPGVPGLLRPRLVVPLLLAALLFTWGWQVTPFADALPVHDVAVDTPFELDGIADEPAWQRAEAVTVATTLPGDALQTVPVTVKALRQGEVMLFLFSWPDSTRSVEHVPMVKTADGWVVQQDGFLKNDERGYYEDKFAVLLSTNGRAIGGNSMHTGKPPGHTAAAGVVSERGYHAVDAGAPLVDVWHWKSVRLAPFGQLDDNHFGAPYPVVPGARRYTAGYTQDPAVSGGYSDNWQWLGDGHVLPKRLPMDPAVLAPFQRSDGGDQPWGLRWYETLPYSADRDTYPVGTRMPSVLWKTVFEGDRGNVQAQGRWVDGRWTLEVRRGIKSDSKFDVSLDDGVYFWVSVFDHTQTLHTYHVRPLRIRFDGALPVKDEDPR